MPNVFPEGIKTQKHHINNWFIIPVPEQTHKIAMRNRYYHRKRINELIEKYFMLDLSLFGGLFLKEPN